MTASVMEPDIISYRERKIIIKFIHSKATTFTYLAFGRTLTKAQITIFTVRCRSDVLARDKLLTSKGVFPPEICVDFHLLSLLIPYEIK